MILLEPIRIILPQNQAIMEGQGESSMVRFFHHIVACEAFYVHNNTVICKSTVPEQYCDLHRTQENRTRRVIAPCIHVSVM